MARTELVYVTYIAASQQKVWEALLEPRFTQQYWKHVNISDWKPGSRWEHREGSASGKLKLVGEVIEFFPPRRLVMSWGEPADAGNRAAQSRVSITLEPVGEMVRLIVHHDELPGPDALRGVADGWARVVSSLKSLLETGRALDTWEGH